MSNGDTISKYKSLIKDIGLFAISSFGSKILMLLLTPLYTSIIATEEYGIADLINTTINFIYPILTLAIADATLRYALDKNVSKSAVLNISIFFTLTSIVALIACYPLNNLLSESLKSYWTVFVIIYALFNIQNCFSNFIKGIGKTSLFAVQGIIQTITIIVCNVLFLVVLKNGLDGYLMSIIMGYTVPILIMFFCGKLYLYIKPLKIDILIIRDMLKYSIPMIPTLLAWAINTSIDKYMIIAMAGLSASGIYSVAHKIPTMFTTLLSVFTQAWQISAISNYGSDDESEYYTQIYSGLNLISISGCVMIILLAKWVSSFLFAKDYFIAWQYVPMLTISAMFSSHAGFLAAAFRAAQKTKSLFVTVFVVTVTEISLYLIVLNGIGTLGAAITTAASFMVVWALRLIMVKKIVRIEINIPATTITYALLLASASLITFEVKYCSYILILSYIIIIAINYRDALHVLSSLKKLFFIKIKR